MNKVFILVISLSLWGIRATYCQGNISLEAPLAGNCGDDTVLTCHFTGALGSSWRWIGSSRDIMTNGRLIDTNNAGKYEESVGSTAFSLTIRNTDISDSGSYSCSVGFDLSAFRNISFECKPNTLTINITTNRTLDIHIDGIYPNASDIIVEVIELTTLSNTTLQGTYICKVSETAPSMYSCNWMMTNATMDDGSYSLLMEVTTLTQTLLNGTFRIKTAGEISLLPSGTTFLQDEGAVMTAITCVADCAPACVYTWTKVGRHSTTLVANGSTLSLGRVRRSFSGIYSCLAKNMFGSTTKNITLDVIYGPESLLTMPSNKDYILNAGTSLPAITCSATCYRQCSYKWTKGGNQEITDNGTLSLGELSREDAALYTCQVKNPDRKNDQILSTNIMVNVRYGPSAIVFNTNRNVSMTLDQPAKNVSCTAECYPECTFVWTNRSDNSVIGDDGVLVLGIVTNYHQGIYRCTAINTAQEFQKTLYDDIYITVTFPTAESESGVSGALAGGIAAAVTTTVAIVAAILICVVIKKKQPPQTDTSYINPTPGVKTKNYFRPLQTNLADEHLYDEVNQERSTSGFTNEEVTQESNDVELGGYVNLQLDLQAEDDKVTLDPPTHKTSGV